MNRCKGCKYHNREVNCCEYMLMTGKSRECLPGSQCTATMRTKMIAFFERFISAVWWVAAVAVALACIFLPIFLAVVNPWWLLLMFVTIPAAAALLGLD